MADSRRASAAPSVASANKAPAGNVTFPPTSTRLSEKDKEKEKILDQLVEQLRQRVKDLQPLPDEPDYIWKDETLVRFVRAREYNLKDSEKQLRHAVEWRRKHRPLNTTCKSCLKKPGLHSIRQVGFDLEGRPVIYMCMEQCSSSKQSVDSTVEHVVSLCESTIATFQDGAPPSWTWLVDCRGLSIMGCSPSLAQEVLGTLGLCYPEYLHRVIVTHHNSMFHNLWKMIKVFVDPKSIEKVRFVRKRDKLQVLFKSMFGDELIDWLNEELRLNSLDKLPEAQKRFYLPPPPGVTHDARGSNAYIKQCVLPFAEKFKAEQKLLLAGQAVPLRVHRPHPNICENLLGNKYLTTAESESSIPLITPAFDFIREVIPFGKDDKNGTASSSGNTDEQKWQSESAAESIDNCSNNAAIRGDDDVSDDELEDDASVASASGTTQNNEDKAETSKDGNSNSVMESLSSATNRISTFFRPSTSK